MPQSTKTEMSKGEKEKINFMLKKMQHHLPN
jgi:hypothetical protein